MLESYCKQHAKAPETEEVVGSEPLLAKNPQCHLANVGTLFLTLGHYN